MNNTIKVILSPNPLLQISNPLNPIGNIKDYVKDQVQEAIMGALEAIRDTILDLSYSIALVGGGVSILLWLAGWEKGKNWAGILFMANILIKFLLGGGI